MLVFSGLTAYVPIPSTAGILMVVSWDLIDGHHIRSIIKAGHSERDAAGDLYRHAGDGDGD